MNRPHPQIFLARWLAIAKTRTSYSLKTKKLGGKSYEKNHLHSIDQRNDD